MAKKELLIPFDADGHLVINDSWNRVKNDYRPNIVFKDTLRFTHIDRDGRFHFLTSMDKRVAVIASDLDPFIRRLQSGVVEGTFTFRKHGTVSGIVLVKETVL